MIRYNTSNVAPAYALRYCWYGWLSQGSESTWPEGLSTRIGPLWANDGLRVLSATRKREQVSILFSTTPNVSPVFLTQRAKGRLAHQLRIEQVPCKFSRKVSLRALGENNQKEVEDYIASQVDKEQFVDPRFSEQMKKFHCSWDDVNLDEPIAVSHGRYWYSLHVVLVTDARYRICCSSTLEAIKSGLIAVREKESYGYKSLQVMPDHLHVLLQANVEQSPAEVVERIQNETAVSVGSRLWRETFYVGTVGSYSMNVVRGRAEALPTQGLQGPER
jgi:REP element-mobilizing transposase RayT